MTLDNFDPTKFTASNESIMNAFLELHIQQTAMLRVIIVNQAKILHQLDDSIEVIDYAKDAQELFDKTALDLKASVLSSL